MASRTQIRLQQLTGSLSAPGALGSQVALASLSAGHLGELLAEMGQAIARIHGEKDFTNKAAGVFGHASQFESTLQVDGAADLKSSAVISGSAEMKSTLAVDGAATMSSTLAVAGNADLQAELDVAQAARMASTLAVTGESTLASATISDLTSGRVVLAGTAGSIEDSASLTFDGTILSAPEASFSTEVIAASAQISDLTAGRVVLAGTSGEIEDNANLTFDGSKLTVTGTQQVTSHMDIDGNLDVAGAAALANTLSVAENATFAKDISAVNGTFSSDISAVNATLSADLSAVSGSFSGDVTISGDLTVNGATTTIDTQNLLVEDPLIVLAKNQTGAAAVDQGLVFQRQGDNQGMIWDESTDEFAFVNIGTEDGTTEGDVAISSYAKLHIGDLAAADAVFSADVAAVSGSFSGDMSVSGDMTAASAAIAGLVEAGSADIAGELAAATIKIDGDTAQRLYIVDADGSMKDEAKLIFDQTKLAITGDEEVSGYVRADKFEIDGATNYIDTNEMGMSEVNLVSAAGLFALKKGANMFGAIQDSAGAMALMPAETAHIEILSGSGAEIARFEAAGLQMEGVHKVQFNDANEAIWSSTNELMFKSNGVEYAWPQADAAFADYVLVSDANGQLSWKSADASAAASAVKYVEVLSAAVTAGNDFSFAGEDLTGLDSKDAHMIDIYVNGQLLNSIKSQSAGVYTLADDEDAVINTADGKMRFAFDLEIDDVVTLIGR